jgi:hypothetical protein
MAAHGQMPVACRHGDRPVLDEAQRRMSRRQKPSTIATGRKRGKRPLGDLQRLAAALWSRLPAARPSPPRRPGSGRDWSLARASARHSAERAASTRSTRRACSPEAASQPRRSGLQSLASAWCGRPDEDVVLVGRSEALAQCVLWPSSLIAWEIKRAFPAAARPTYARHGGPIQTVPGRGVAYRLDALLGARGLRPWPALVRISYIRPSVCRPLGLEHATGVGESARSMSV